MRSKNYVTLMDPFQEKYGNTIAAVLFIPTLMADIFWVACILGALGTTVSVIMDISRYVSVSLSAVVAIVYTVLGGLYSVAYTDVIQLIFMFFGLWLCVPFVLTSPYYNSITESAVSKIYQEPWIGQIKLEDAGSWVDNVLLLTIGGICYQAFHQRVLSAASDAQAKLTCFAGAVLCPILGIPSVLVGAVAASTDWNQTSFGGPSPYEQGKAGLILPITLQHLCPLFVSLVGMGALAAAVMSSVDSVLLSAASQIARNIYKNILHRKGRCWHNNYLCSSVLDRKCRCLILSDDTPSHLHSLSAPLGEPLWGLLWFCVGTPPASPGREPLLGLPSVLPLPWDKILEDGQRQHGIPFRTAIVIITFATILCVSQITTWMSGKGLFRRTTGTVL
ncbi:hypothetical protein WMY93_013804 [Mugilogobius chulae]|uniref:Uncharacterized protein n=1 Tax=Mugilogobius chulae TaxID=88201 RepID=A0AAW0P1A9_9GOBI